MDILSKGAQKEFAWAAKSKIYAVADSHGLITMPSKSELLEGRKLSDFPKNDQVKFMKNYVALAGRIARYNLGVIFEWKKIEQVKRAYDSITASAVKAGKVDGFKPKSKKKKSKSIF